MSVFFEVNLGCNRPEPSQRRIAEVVQLEPSDRVCPTNSLVEDGEMCQASDTAAANHLCPTFVATLTKPFYIAEQALREPLERFQKPIA
jgi:hypothetical protein